MCYDFHISEMCKKVNGTLLYLNKIKDRFDNEMRRMVVQSLALSIINYCLKIWGSTNKQQLRQVQMAQNFAAKVIDGKARKFDHVSPIFKKLEWLNIEQKIKFEIGTLIYKILNGMLPAWLLPLTTVGSRRERQMRNDNDLFIPRSLVLKGPII